MISELHLIFEGCFNFLHWFHGMVDADGLINMIILFLKFKSLNLKRVGDLLRSLALDAQDHEEPGWGLQSIIIRPPL